MGEGPTWISPSVHVCGTDSQKKGEIERENKVRRHPEDVPVQSHMPGDSQPEAEGTQRSGWGSGSRPRPGEALQSDVLGNGAAVLRSRHAVDGKQTQRCGGAQTVGGVSELPLAVAARHGEESDRHGLQVTSPVCVCDVFVSCVLRTEAHILRPTGCHDNL